MTSPMDFTNNGKIHGEKKITSEKYCLTCFMLYNICGIVLLHSITMHTCILHQYLCIYCKIKKHILQNKKTYIVFCKLIFSKKWGKMYEFYLIFLFVLVFFGKIPGKKTFFFNVPCHIVFAYANV